MFVLKLYYTKSMKSIIVSRNKFPIKMVPWKPGRQLKLKDTATII